MIRKKWWGKDRLWLFSGSFKDLGGTTVDINPKVSPDHVCDCAVLPFPDNSFDFVMADPPYSIEEARRLYDLPYFKMIDTLNEMARVCKPGGYALFLHRIFPECHPQLNIEFKKLQIVGLVGVTTLSGLTNIRALTVWRKGETLDPYVMNLEK